MAAPVSLPPTAASEVGKPSDPQGNTPPARPIKVAQGAFIPCMMCGRPVRYIAMFPDGRNYAVHGSVALVQYCQTRW